MSFSIKNRLFYFLAVPDLEGYVLAAPINDEYAGSDYWGSTTLRLAVRLFLAHRETIETVNRLRIQKKQFDRKSAVLEKKFQDIMAENEQNYLKIQEQQRNYSDP